MANYLAIFGCAILIMIEVWYGVRLVLEGQELLAKQANANYAALLSRMDVKPDDKPLPVKVTRPTKDDWTKFVDFEASQVLTMDEFKES
jgi:hypothetical protein